MRLIRGRAKHVPGFLDRLSSSFVRRHVLFSVLQFAFSLGGVYTIHFHTLQIHVDPV